jgi:hypothetical protein
VAAEVGALFSSRRICVRDELVQRAVGIEALQVSEVEVPSVQKHEPSRSLGIQRGEPAADRGSPREAEKDGAGDFQFVEDLGDQPGQRRRPVDAVDSPQDRAEMLPPQSLIRGSAATTARPSRPADRAAG